MKLLTFIIIALFYTQAYTAETVDISSVLTVYENNTAFLKKPHSFDYKDSFGQYGSVNFSAERTRVVQHIYRGNQLKDLSWREVLLSGGDGMLFERSPFEFDGTVFSNIKQRDFGNAVYNYFSFPFLLRFVPDGNMSDLIPISDFLRKSNLEFESRDNGNVCFQGNNDGYQVKVCFDENNNLVSLFYASAKTKYEIDDVLFVHEYSLNFGRYTQINGNYVPESASIYKKLVLSETKMNNGKEEQECFIDNEPPKIDVALSNYILDRVFTESDLTFTEEVTNGTNAVMEDAPHIRHVWLDGKVVPWTDEVMYAIATEGHEFKPGYSEPRFWMITISIVLFALAFAKLIYDYCKNKK